MRLFQSGTCVAALICLAATVAAPQSNGPLRVHPENPRYFTDDSGRAILLAGSHTWANIVDMGLSDPPAPFNFDAHLAWLRRYGHNFTRGWTWEPTRWDTSTMPADWANRDLNVFPHPWPRTGPGLALDGKPKFDLQQVNPIYLQRLKDRVAAAQAHGIFISIMLFEGFGVQFRSEAWPAHPFNAANNINGVDGDANGDGKGIEVHQLANQRVTQLQETYVRSVLEVLNDFDNVLYEISNETHPSSTEWQYHMIRFIKACEAEMPKQHPVGMTYQNRRGANRTLFESPADWVSPNREWKDGNFRDDPPDMKGRKVVLSDTDHLWGIGGDSAWVWKTVLRGLNPIFMDPYDGAVLVGRETPEYETARIAIGQVLALSRRIDLAHSTPRNELSSTGYCLAEPGVSYVVFAPEGGSFDVDLTATDGVLSVEWMNPVTGQSATAEAVAGGALHQFTTQDGEPVVLLIRNTSRI